MLKTFILFCLFFLFSLLLSKDAFAVSSCKDAGLTPIISYPIPEGIKSINIVFPMTGTDKYQLAFGPYARAGIDYYNDSNEATPGSDGRLTLTLTEGSGELYSGPHWGRLKKNGQDYCNAVEFFIGANDQNCQLSYTYPDPKDNEEIRVSVTSARQGKYTLLLSDGNYVREINNGAKVIDVGPTGNGSAIIGPLNYTYNGRLGLKFISPAGTALFCAKEIKVTSSGGNSPRLLPPINPNATPLPPAAKVCSGKDCSSGGGKQIEGCSKPGSPGYDPKNPGIATAIGCIHTNPAELAKDLLKFMIAIGGGLAFLMMLLGAFQMLTSQGNPETLNAGKERLTSAVIGLLFIIFAVLLLQIIGADILQIEGFK